MNSSILAARKPGVSKHVLDASALLALLNGETGAGVVQDLLADSVISSINFSEVVACLALHGLPPEEIHNVLDILGLEIVPFETDNAYSTGLLAPKTKLFGLSLGDRACISLAMKTGATAVSADRIWGKMDLNIKIKIIRY
jgi:ribonuclease VapC